MKYDIDTYLAAIGIKSSEFFDASKIRIEIYSIKKEKDKVLLHIGNMIYRMFLQDKFDKSKLIEKCKPIVNMNEQIKLKEQEINQIHEGAQKDIKENFMKSKDMHRKHKNKPKKKHKQNKDLIEVESYQVRHLD